MRKKENRTELKSRRGQEGEEFAAVRNVVKRMSSTVDV